MDDEPRIAAYDDRVDWWLTGLAVLFLVVYAVQVLAQPTGTADAACEVVLTGVWVLFGLDYAVRIALARRRWRFVGTHLVDLAILLLPCASGGTCGCSPGPCG
jgi:voltage-gated potassium channel